MGDKRDQSAEQRVVTVMPRRLIERIDDFRYGRRIPGRAEAIRRLIETGLRCEDSPQQSVSRERR